MNELLLDTCALIWVLGGERMTPAAVQAIGDRPISVSAVSALELGILMRKGRIVIATAKAHDLTVVTRDRLILAYCEEQDVRALPC